MSLLQAFKDECRKLSVTAPVFTINIVTGGWQGKSLVLEPINKISHHDDVTDEMWQTDPIKTLAMHCSRETIDANSKSYSISVESSTHNLRSKLRTEICNFIYTNVPMGRDSDIYKWYDRFATSENVLMRQYMETMLGIFKYIQLNTVNYVIDEKHKQNAIGLLELIYQRDFRPEHVPQPQKRRRRRK